MKQPILRIKTIDKQDILPTAEQMQMSPLPVSLSWEEHNS